MGLFGGRGAQATGSSSAKLQAASQSQTPSQAQKQTQKQVQSQEQKQDEGFAPSGFSAEHVEFSFDFDTQESEESILRRMRSQAYMDVVASIDLLSSTDEEIIEKLKEVVDEETLEAFGDMSTEEMLEELRLSFEEEMEQRQLELQKLPQPVKLLGIISQCFIGPGYDIHAIDHSGNILEHYRKGCRLEKEFDFARKLWYERKGNCNCIEIYSNACCIVAADGSVETIYYDLA